MGWRSAILGFVSIVVAAAILGISSGQSDPGPPLPPWVNADGTDDISKMPERIEVAGPDGKPVRDCNGNPVTVPSRPELPPPPSEIETEDAPRKVVKDHWGNTVEVIEDAEGFGFEHPVC